MEPAIGIDLGTTHCCVAVYQNGVAEVILNDQGNKTTPSMVAFTDTEILLGEAAKHQVATNPANTVFDIKRLIGRRFADPSVQADIRQWPFTVVPDAAGADPLVEVEYQGRRQRYTPQQISSMVLAKMKSIAEAYLGSAVRHAVVTVPAYFTDSQRECTKAAAALAGLHVLRIINEPSAAAVAYGFRPEVLAGADGAGTVLVFDLGGGTFDVSVVNVHGGGRFDVVASAGDMRLGGEDFDSNLVDHCVAQFHRRNPAAARSDIRRHPRALRRLRAECERAKRNLSAAQGTHIHIDGLLDGCDLALRISRERFQELNEALFRRCIDVVRACLADAGIAADAVDHVLLVGGSTRIPRVQELILEFFGGRNVLCRNVNPDEAVAVGAAIQAASLHSEATEVAVELQDVLPVSLGVSIDGGQMSVVLPKNTPIPAQRERVYTTRLDNQSEVSFPVYEGDNARVKDNYLVGEFKLTGIPPAPAGQPDIKVLFCVDENGILTVTATDTNRAQSTIVITKARQLQDSGSVNGKRPVIPASPDPKSGAVEEASCPVKNSRRWWHIFTCG